MIANKYLFFVNIYRINILIISSINCFQPESRWICCCAKIDTKTKAVINTKIKFRILYDSVRDALFRRFSINTKPYMNQKNTITPPRNMPERVLIMKEKA